MYRRGEHHFFSDPGGVFSLGRPIRPQTSRDRRAVNGVDVTKVPQKDKVEGEKGPVSIQGPTMTHGVLAL